MGKLVNNLFGNKKKEESKDKVMNEEILKKEQEIENILKNDEKENTLDRLHDIIVANRNHEFTKKFKEFIVDEIPKLYGKEKYIATFFNLFFSFRRNNVKLYHVTHNDGDAIGCASFIRFVLDSNLKGYELDDILKTYFCDTNGASRCITEEIMCNSELGETVFLLITDINIDDDTYNRINSSSYVIPLLIDHHPTNLRGNNDWCYVDSVSKLSASALLFNLVSPSYYINSYKEDKVNRYGNNLISYDKDLNRIIRKRINEILYDIYGNDWGYPFLCDAIVLEDRSSFDDYNIFQNVARYMNDISRYDTWEWMNSKSILENEDNTSAAIKVMLKDLHKLSSMISDDLCKGNYPFSDSTLEYLIYRYKDLEIEEVQRELANVQCISILGFNGIPTVLYAGNYANAIMQAMYKQFIEAPFVVMVYPVSNTISLRTNKPDVDVSELAVKFRYRNKGGGHKTAAGFTPSPDLMIDILSKYYVAKNNTTGK